jgi:hypothetical protein
MLKRLLSASRFLLPPMLGARSPERILNSFRKQRIDRVRPVGRQDVARKSSLPPKGDIEQSKRCAG